MLKTRFIAVALACAVMVGCTRHADGATTAPPAEAEIATTATQSDVKVRYTKGGKHDLGDDAAQDYAQYQLAAQQGHAAAQYALGLMYDRGKGVKQSDAEAVRWYQLSAQQGYAEAQTNLGAMYAAGRGVSQN